MTFTVVGLVIVIPLVAYAVLPWLHDRELDLEAWVARRHEDD